MFYTISNMVSPKEVLNLSGNKIIVNEFINLDYYWFDFFQSSVNSYAFLQSNTVYRTVQEFIDGNSKFTDLKMGSFKLLFIIYISFCLIVLIINLLHYLFIKIHKII